MLGKLESFDSNKIYNYTGFSQVLESSVKSNKDLTCIPILDGQN